MAGLTAPEPFSKEALIVGYQLNLNKTALATLRTYCGVLAGIVAGILGLEGLRGVLCYFAITFIGSFFLWIRLGCCANDYFLTAGEIWSQQLGAGMLTFILIWTFFYDAIHIF